MPTHLKSLHRLMYVSKATDFKATRSREVMSSILSSAMRRNKDAGVSGALLACDQWFVQALEGTRMKVGEIYGLVCNDRRHDNIRLIDARPVDTRLFGDWAMCGETLSAKDAAIVHLLGSRKDLDPNKLTGASALSLLRIVRKIQSAPKTVTYL